MLHLCYLIGINPHILSTLVLISTPLTEESEPLW